MTATGSSFVAVLFGRMAVAEVVGVDGDGGEGGVGATLRGKWAVIRKYNS